MHRFFASVATLVVIATGCSSASTLPTGGSSPSTTQAQPSIQRTPTLTATPAATAVATVASQQPSVGPTTSTTPSTAPTTASQPAGSALEDIWLLDQVKPEQIEATLRAAGLQKWVQPFRSNIGEENAFKLRIRGGQWSLYYSKDRGPFDNIDQGTYTIAGDTVAVRHTEGSDVFDWTATDDELKLTWASDTFPETAGIPEEVYGRAFYSSAPFERQP
jgi:hypothetical protein